MDQIINGYGPKERAILSDSEWFRLINQSAVRQKFFTDVQHNAMWDFFVTKSGRVFFPLCAELTFPEIVRFYEYLPETNEFKLHFKLEERVFQHETAIRTSKIHTSICEMKDGRLIMTTHTTARSPVHPDWMPFAYYTHPWEGYQGSIVIIYDPDTGVLENRGVPVPHESIYGAKYDEKHNALYFTGWARGHMYRLDLDTNILIDYGKVTEYGSFRIAEGPDGNFYCSSRSGSFFRVNAETRQLEDLGMLPNNNGIYSENHCVLSFTFNYENKLYFTVYNAKGLWSYDPVTNTMEYVGDFRPRIGGMMPDLENDSSTPPLGYGLCLDDRNCLWYGYSNIALHLVKWDLFRGGKPEDMGVIGTEARAVVNLSEMYFHDRKLYLADTNHSYDGPGVVVVDLDALGKTGNSLDNRPISGDIFVYYRYLLITQDPLLGGIGYTPPEDGRAKPLHEIYPGENFEDKFAEITKSEGRVTPLMQFKEKNKHWFDQPCKPILLWKVLGPGKSMVFDLFYREGDLLAIAGDEEEKYLLTIRDGQVIRIEKTQWERPPVSERLMALSYPYYPGRQYKAIPSCAAAWNGGRYVVGTEDGMLAVVNGDQVFSLGTAGPNGSVNALAANAEQTVLYGVTGDAMDLGNIFSYTDETGLRWEGTAFRETVIEGVTMFANRLSAIALSPSGDALAIGSRDRIGVILLYSLC